MGAAAPDVQQAVLAYATSIGCIGYQDDWTTEQLAQVLAHPQLQQQGAAPAATWTEEPF
jgi:hypothetical protein